MSCCPDSSSKWHAVEFVIAKAGKPMVRVVPLQAPPALRVLGFLAGEGTISADMKACFATEIDSMFGGSRRR
jgi:antitoxin (DNA-binding transcriptional repressor) of toxin-antitoxin stability system